MVTRNPFTKFVRRHHARPEMIWVRLFHHKLSYQPAAKSLLYFDVLGHLTIWTTLNSSTALLCFITKRYSNSRSVCVIHRTKALLNKLYCSKVEPYNLIRCVTLIIMGCHRLNSDLLTVQELNIYFGTLKEAWIAHIISYLPPIRAWLLQLTCSID